MALKICFSADISIEQNSATFAATETHHSKPKHITLTLNY